MLEGKSQPRSQGLPSYPSIARARSGRGKGSGKMRDPGNEMGKSMPSNMAAFTNHATLLKNQSAIKYLP